MPEQLPNVGVLLACFLTDAQISNSQNGIQTWSFEYKYNVQCFWLKRLWNIIIQAGIFREYWNKCFWRTNALEKAPAQFIASWILSRKGEVQIMPFQKLSGKCHLLLWFCTHNWSETYIMLCLKGRVLRLPKIVHKTLPQCLKLDLMEFFPVRSLPDLLENYS